MIDPDIITKLEERQRELLSVFLTESDPAQWPQGDGRDDRGDRVWMKKDAQTTISLIAIIGRILDQSGPEPIKQAVHDLEAKTEEKAEADAQANIIKDAEARAKRMTGRNGSQTPH